MAKKVVQLVVKKPVKSVKLGTGMLERARAMLGGRVRKLETDVDALSQGYAPKKRR